jgi:Class III cytochrome C family
MISRFTLMSAALLGALFLSYGTAHAFECKVCHSKNPAMVRMHQAVQGRGCFDCHKVGEKLMGKGQQKDLASLMKRRVADSLCVECHKGT